MGLPVIGYRLVDFITRVDIRFFFFTEGNEGNKEKNPLLSLFASVRKRLRSAQPPFFLCTLAAWRESCFKTIFQCSWAYLKSSLSSPDCRNIEANVPFGISFLGSGIITIRLAFLNFLWLPF